MSSAGSLYIIHTEASRGWGGQELRILVEAQGMIGRGHRVEIWAPQASDIYAEAGRRAIPREALPIDRRNLATLLAVRGELQRRHPDVVNTHSSTDSWLVALASRTLRRPPAVVRTRHISPPVANDFATRWLYRSGVQHVVTTGERMREVLIRDNHMSPSHLTSIPTGVDGERFKPGDKLHARQRLGLAPENRYIGIIATLRSWKGHLYLLDAFARLAVNDDHLRLLIVGDGPMFDALRAHVAALGITPKVMFAGRQETVERWLHATDVFCLPSYANEGVPQAVVQAMLAGVPVVTTNIGSIDEAIKDNVTGLVVPPRDIDALADALQRLLRDQGLGARLVRAARKHAIESFGLERMLTRMERIFRDAIEERSRSYSSHQ
jgi:glycosyltransferase involved in cell wall biosynthesis